MHTGRLSQQHNLAELHEVLPDRVIDSVPELPRFATDRSRYAPSGQPLAVSLDSTISSVHRGSAVKYYELPIQLGKPCGALTRRSNSRWIP